jgi:hypothetical protein
MEELQQGFDDEIGDAEKDSINVLRYDGREK